MTDTKPAATATVPKKRPTLRFRTGSDIQVYRKKARLNQAKFWARIGVTQSGGSRYESGRDIPKPVQMLLHLAYGTAAQAQALLDWLRDGQTDALHDSSNLPPEQAPETPDDLSAPYPILREWEEMPEVGLEQWPTYYDDDVAAWAEDQAQALQDREASKLDWNNLAEKILDAAKAERRELGMRVTKLMTTLAAYRLNDAAPKAAIARRIEAQRRLVWWQLSDCPSLQRYMSDHSWLSMCWSNAVAALGTEGQAVESLPDKNPWDKDALLGERTE